MNVCGEDTSELDFANNSFVNEQPQKIWLTSSLISFSCALTILFLFSLARRGLESELPQLASALLAFLGFLGATRIATRYRIRGLGPEFTVPLAAILFFGLIVSAIYQPHLVVVALVLLSVAALFPAPRLRKVAAICVGFGVIVGTALFLWTNTIGYASIYAVELTMLGAGKKDTVFHSAIAAMLQTYGVVTTGLSGFTPLHYYVASHGVVAGLATIDSVLPLWAYASVQQVLFLPCFIFSLAYAAGAMINSSSARTLGLLISVVLTSSMFMWPSYLVSESFTMSLTILFLSLPCLFLCLGPLSPRNISEFGVWILFLAIIVAALAVTKMSTAIVAALFVATAVVQRFLAPSSFRAVALACSWILTAAIVILLYSFLASWPLNFLAFPIENTGEFGAELSLSLIGLILFRLASSSPAFADHSTAWPAIISASTIAFLPGLFVYIAGGGAAYFQLPVALIACIPIAATLDAAISSARWTRPSSADLTGFGVAGALVLMALSSDFRPSWAQLTGLTVQSKLLHQAKSKLDTKAIYAPPFGAIGFNGLLQIGQIFATFDPRIKALAASSYLGVLHDEMAVHDRKDVASMFAPPSATAYWGSHVDCSAQPFLGPAVTGRSMILGLPPSQNSCSLVAYGYAAYTSQDRSRALSNLELCHIALQRHITSVLIISNDPKGNKSPTLCR